MFIKKYLDFFGIQLENEDKVKSKACDVSHTNIIQVTVVQALFEFASTLLSENSVRNTCSSWPMLNICHFVLKLQRI